METKQFNTQNFYPKYLDQDEINDPLIVIRDFFSADWLPGHLEKLLEWRKYVIEEGYYKDNKNSPASLLYTYQLNVRLLEATFLLSKTRHAVKLAKCIHINFEVQLQQEEEEWLHYPVHLSPAECINPYLAVSNFFKAYTIDEYRDFLYEWLETGLSNDAIDETLDVSDIIYFYEHMQKLYEAAWIIRQRELEPALKKSADENEPVLRTILSKTASLSLVNSNCNFNQQLTSTESFGLNKLIKLMLAEISLVQLIICLGTHPLPDTYYLLVVIAEEEKIPEHEIANKIEDTCRHLINVYVILHKTGAFIKALEDGSCFFTNALMNNKICYQPDDIILPEFKSIDQKVLKATIESYWKRWGYQGKGFLDAALRCFDEGNYNLAVFLMHQAVESSLNAIIRINLGYRLTVHNLSRMLRLTLLFTDDLRNVFKLGMIGDVQLFALLQSGYSAARYKEDFNPDKESVTALSDKVSKLVIITETLYKQAFNSLKA